MSKRSEFNRKAEENFQKTKDLSYLSLDTSKSWRRVSKNLKQACESQSTPSVARALLRLKTYHGDLGTRLVDLFDEAQSAIDDYYRALKKTHRMIEHNPEKMDARLLPGTDAIDRLAETFEKEKLRVGAVGMALNLN